MNRYSRKRSIYAFIVFTWIFSGLINSACGDSAKIPSELYDLKINLELKNGALPVWKTQIIEDLSSLSQLRGTALTKLHRRLFGNSVFEGDVYMRFIVNNVDEIRVKTFFGRVASSASPSQQRPPGSQRVIWLFDGYFNLSQIQRWAVLIHEAAHIKSGISHVACGGFYACDDRIDGSIGHEAAFLLAVHSSCSVCSNQIRTSAGLQGMELIPNLPRFAKFHLLGHKKASNSANQGESPRFYLPFR